MVIPLPLVVPLYIDSSAAILKDASEKLAHARTISFTSVYVVEEFPRERRSKYWLKKGGYFRSEAGPMVDISDPGIGWTYQSKRRAFQIRKTVGRDFDIASVAGLELFRPSQRPIGLPRPMRWHGHDAVRIEVDGTYMTKETRLYLFVAPKTHTPIGISANLGSVTQVTLFEGLKIDAPTPDSLFSWTPPTDWKRVKPGEGGWN
jgi:hypothetical protein